MCINEKGSHVCQSSKHDYRKMKHNMQCKSGYTLLQSESNRYKLHYCVT